MMGSCDLRINLEDFDNVTKYAVNNNFKVDGEKYGYRLALGKFEGDAGKKRI